MSKDNSPLRILTLNIWGAPNGKHRSARITAIAAELKRLQPDIITLQEVYLEGNREALLGLISDTWPHHRYFASSVLGSGLLTLSRYPIVDSQFLKFRMSGKPEKILHGDYYAGKGIGLTRIQTPQGLLDVYNSHTHAQYQHEDLNEYTVYNACNLYEAARFITAHSVANPLILCGDLNTQIHQIGYRIIQQLAGLTDAYAYLHGDAEGITFSPQNVYTDSPPQRLDYMMLRATGQRSARINSMEIIMTETLPAKSGALHFSDHYGLITEIEFTDSSNNLTHIDPGQSGAVLDEFLSLLNDSLMDVLATKSAHSDRATLGLMSVPDAYFTGGLIRKMLPLPGMRLLLLGAALSFSLYHGLQSQINYTARKQTIEAFIAEASLHRQQQALSQNARS